MLKRLILNLPNICTAIAGICVALISLDAVTGDNSAKDLLDLSQIRILALAGAAFGALGKSALAALVAKVVYGEDGALPRSERVTPRAVPILVDSEGKPGAGQ